MGMGMKKDGRRSRGVGSSFDSSIPRVGIMMAVLVLARIMTIHNSGHAFQLLARRRRCRFGFPRLLVEPSSERMSIALIQLRATKASPEETMESTNKNEGQPSFGLYDIQESMLVKRGQLEQELMSSNVDNCRALSATKPRGIGGGGGFGGGGGGDKKHSKATLNKAQGAAYATVLKEVGVVRIDKILPKSVAKELRSYVLDLSERGRAQVESGEVRSLDRFADVLLKEQRSDVKIPLGPEPVMKALKAFLQSPVRATVESMYGDSDEAVLYELSCLISKPGSPRQVVHPDTPCRPNTDEPALLTCFMALQDITEEMGPTVWIPRTNTAEAHASFQQEQPVSVYNDESPKDHLIRTSPSVMGLLPQGACAIFDSRTLHCGTANKAQEDRSGKQSTTRALFYASFKHPEVGFPGNPPSIGYGLDSARLTLRELSEGLLSSDKKTKASLEVKLKSLYCDP